MKILFVENFNTNEDNPMSTLYPLRCKKIKENINFDIYDIGSNKIIDYNLYNTVIFGARSLYLYKFYKSSQKKILKERFENLMKLKNKFFLIQDMHKKTYGNIKSLCELLNNNNINIIFTFYNNSEAHLIRKLTPNCKHYHLPLHIDKNIFNDKKMEKKYDILLYGSIHPTHYPFRKRLFELLLTKKHKYNICYIEKPENFDSNKCEHGLANLINQSRISIATKSKYDYFVAKYLEIVFCKSYVAGNMATDGINIFGNNYLKLTEQMTDEEIFNNIDECLNNYEKYSSQIEYLYDKLLDYNIDNYVLKLLNILTIN